MLSREDLVEAEGADTNYYVADEEKEMEGGAASADAGKGGEKIGSGVVGNGFVKEAPI